MTELSNKIISTIKKEAIVMKPRYYFMLRSLLLVSGAVLVLLISLYGLSFILFFLRESGLWFLPHFGLIGVLWFITHSPWIIITITGIFLGSLFLLIRHFRFSYQQPAIYTLVGLVLLVIGGASLLEYVAIHDRVRDFSQANNMPHVVRFYDRQSDTAPRGVVPGEIIALSEKTITIKTPRNETIEVGLTADTRLPTSPLSIGKSVFIFGHRTGTSTIEALGIRDIDSQMKRVPMHQH